VPGVAVDASGNLYIPDRNGNRIRKVTASGTITTIAGNGTCGYSGDGGPAVNAEICYSLGAAVDAAGNLYFTGISVVRKITPDGTITTVAGNGGYGYSGDGGPATSATLEGPQAVAVDAVGNIYIADTNANVIRRVAPDGMIATVAGNGNAGFSGDGGPATSAQLSTPVAVATDAAGNLYIAEFGNEVVRRVTRDGTITTVAGTPDYYGNFGDAGPATKAVLNAPEALTLDAVGNLYVADSGNGRIRVVTPDGTITTVAGNGQQGYSGDGGPATGAELNYPDGLTVDAAGNIYIADQANFAVRVLVPVNTLPVLTVTKTHRGTPTVGQASAIYSVAVHNAANAGSTSGTVTVADGLPAGLTLQSMSGDGWGCSANACTRSDTLGAGASYPPIAVSASINANAPPQFLNEATISGGGILYTATGADTLTIPPAPGTSQIPMLITTDAGGGLPATPSAALSAFMAAPESVAVDATGKVYFIANNCVWKLDASGLVVRVAGTSTESGYSGDGGPALMAGLNGPNGLVLDGAGNLYIADTGNNVIRMMAANGAITTVAGNGTNGYSGDGGPATSAQLNYPYGVAVDTGGNLYIADTGNSRIREVTLDGSITTVAGNGTQGYSGDGASATSAELYYPFGVAVDAAGNLYIADNWNGVVRMVAADGTITTVAGNGKTGYSGDGGPATSAEFDSVIGLTADAAGNIYVADLYNSVIRRFVPNGTITTVAGHANCSTYFGDGGPATSACLQNPRGVTVDGVGDVYIADTSNNRIRKIAPGGTITTIAGNGAAAGNAGDGGPAANAELTTPRAVAADASGNVYIADLGNNRIRKVKPDGTITTVAGNGTAGYSGDGGAATNAQLNGPKGLTLDVAGNLYIGDTSNNVVRKVTPGGTITTTAGNGQQGYSGDGGSATGAQLYGPRGMAVDGSGNLFIADGNNNVIRKVTPKGAITTVAGNGTAGYLGDGGPATSAELSTPIHVALDAKGNLYIADTANKVIRMVAPNGIITTVAGTNDGDVSITYSGDGGLATNAALKTPYCVAVDAAGDLYIADTGNNVIRMVAPNGIITTVAGNGTGGYSGDGGTATSAELNNPYGVALDANGNLYIADTLNSVVRLLTPGTTSPMLSVSLTHQGDFAPGQLGASYSVVVANVGSVGATSGTVTVTDNGYGAHRASRGISGGAGLELFGK
jgi:sugar lactone lactonase YvrE